MIKEAAVFKTAAFIRLTEKIMLEMLTKQEIFPWEIDKVKIREISGQKSF
ncbi:hypothetical protein BMWSH_4433 [Priestia megaterium WSH-002]|uniref:Uncharacterized protein n=2 Tax=Priestia megaterium TaxID=1404 RepID=A0AAX6BEW5_PRIMG|nr:hypothetical protein BMWSH_4433 [Priestia megaterium WSH-002]GMG72324.1 hypothetical protein ShirakiTB12_07920 [Priestia megaterium]